jgi:hypothetical protein
MILRVKTKVLDVKVFLLNDYKLFVVPCNSTRKSLLYLECNLKNVDKL